MKIVAMIPARLGSQRVPKKNLRLINGKPLVSYIVQAAAKADVFDEIYINSESDIFSQFAEDYKVKFYKRPDSLSTNSATNDDFALDFIEKNPCDLLIQLLPTSPFLSPEEIYNFVQEMKDKSYETLISVKNEQIECVYDGGPINFEQRGQTLPSQQLKPIQVYACGIMGWDTERLKANMEKYGAAYHGGDGSVGYFPIKGYSTIDIDNEEDFHLAEVVSRSLLQQKKKPEYYDYEAGKEEKVFDADRERILGADGVQTNIMDNFNKELTQIDNIISEMGRNKSWSYTVVNSPSNSATLIGQLPGEGNRLHYHHDWDEWWYIVEGEWEWLVDGVPKTIRAGELVFIERFRRHKITAKGEKMAIRLAVSRNDVDHVYESEDYKNQ